MAQDLQAASGVARFGGLALDVDPARPLLLVDVDEVLALFVRAFERRIGLEGYEFRLDRYGLLQNVYRPGADQPIEAAEGQALLELFYQRDCEAIEPAPGAAQALEALSRRMTVVVLTNAPDSAGTARLRWLRRHGLDYPMVVNQGAKGPPVAAIAGRTAARVGFVDDLIQNLDSAAEAAPLVRRFHTVADERLRPLAPTSSLHPRVDGWPGLAAAIEEALLA